MVMSRASFPKDLEPGLNAHFGLAYKSYPEEWRALYAIEDSNKSQEEDVLDYGFGAAQVKGEGSTIAEDTGGQGWSQVYVHETIALSFSITEEAVEDNLYQSLGPKYAKELARALQHTKEIKSVEPFNNGFTSYLSGDGVALLATNHPLIAGGTWQNELTTPADLAEASLEDLLVLVRKTVNDRLVPVSLMAKDLVVPPELEYDALRILKTPGRPGTADNDINAVRTKGIFQRDPVTITRLSSAKAWFLTTDAPNGLKHIRRTGVKRGMQEDFATGNMQYKARERYRCGASDPRGIFGSPGV